MGRVFRAFDPEGDRLVAVKLFTLDLPPERVLQFVSGVESVLAANLTHPAIAAPIAVGIYDNHPYLAQEFVSADSLDIAVRGSGPAPPAAALRVAAQLAGALDFAAVVHVEHGALHPRDVLLSPDDTKLTGLGIARAFEHINVAAPVRRPYTPPERIAGGEWDRRADIFSLAALMHDMLWGRRASATGAQAADALTAIAGADLDAMKAVFARALAERPDDRFATALEFADALKQAFPGVIVSEQSPVGSRQARAARRVDADLRLPLEEPVEVERSAGDVSLRESFVEPDDLELREAERARYEDVEAAPAIVDVAPDLSDALAPVKASPGILSGYGDTQSATPDRSQSAIWPIALALVVGVAIGFGGGYFVANVERTLPSPPVAAVEAPAQAPPAAGREFTEGVVATPPAAASAPAPQSANRQPQAAIPPSQSAIRKPQAAVESGRLSVRSTPAGARVFVDGREQGKTPLAIGALTRGVHRVRIAREGYETEERRITITASRPTQAMTVPLSRARQARTRETAAPVPSTPGTTGRFAGALTVISRPPGARVFLDGKLVGTTPLEIPRLDVGSHAVRLDLDGYRTWSSSVRMVASEPNRVTASLEK